MQLFDQIPAQEAIDPLLFEIIEVINQDRKILKVNAENGQLCQSYNITFLHTSNGTLNTAYMHSISR